MIRLDGNMITNEWLAQNYQTGGMLWQIAGKMLSAGTVFTYQSKQALDFELTCRREIVNASERLNNSFFRFLLFVNSECNPEYWDRTQEGGFRLKKRAIPHEAVRDILKNSRKYGTECATAIVIVFYLALVEVLPVELFDRLFSDIYLMDWKYLDADLGVRVHRGVKDSLPGDCLYFKNPDVNPDTPEWQGENVIQLMNGYYYGHGIGVKTAERIIRELNRNRVRGSETSAYLMDQIVKPDFKYLAAKTEAYQQTQNR